METERKSPLTSLRCCRCQTATYPSLEEAVARVTGAFLSLDQVAQIDDWLEESGWDSSKSWLCPPCLFFVMAELV
jgi:hypothetical protein